MEQAIENYSKCKNHFDHSCILDEDKIDFVVNNAVALKNFSRNVSKKREALSVTHLQEILPYPDRFDQFLKSFEYSIYQLLEAIKLCVRISYSNGKMNPKEVASLYSHAPLNCSEDIEKELQLYAIKIVCKSDLDFYDACCYMGERHNVHVLTKILHNIEINQNIIDRLKVRFL